MVLEALAEGQHGSTFRWLKLCVKRACNLPSGDLRIVSRVVGWQNNHLPTLKLFKVPSTS